VYRVKENNYVEYGCSCSGDLGQRVAMMQVQEDADDRASAGDVGQQSAPMMQAQEYEGAADDAAGKCTVPGAPHAYHPEEGGMADPFQSQ